MPIPVVRPFRVASYTQEAESSFTLRLVPDDGQPLFSFQAGQFVMLHLFNEDGSLWAKAAYSIATAPCESKESIDLGIKLHGDFTKRANQLREGDVVGIQGPYGMFVLKPETERLVFFAGGVGVTPLRSMIREVLFTGLSVPMILFYSDKTRAAMAYEQEFRDLAIQYPQFRPVFILSREQPEQWDGEITRLNPQMVKNYLHDFMIGRYCMCGPDEYMSSIKDMLIAEGVDTKTALQRESFG